MVPTPPKEIAMFKRFVRSMLQFPTLPDELLYILLGFSLAMVLVSLMLRR